MTTPELIATLAAADAEQSRLMAALKQVTDPNVCRAIADELYNLELLAEWCECELENKHE